MSSLIDPRFADRGRWGAHGSRLIDHTLGRLWQRWNDAELLTAPARAEWPVGLRRVRAVGLVLIGLQFLLLCWWSAFQASRFSLTPDFSTYEQTMTLIRHTVDPYMTVWHRPFLQDHGVLLEYAFAPLLWLWPHPETIKWLQDAALVGGELAAFGWICDVAASHINKGASARPQLCVALLGAILLVADPWTAWSAAFDAHAGTFAVVWTVAAMRDVVRGRRTAWLWFAIGLLNGDVSTTYQIGVALTAILLGRRYLRQGVPMLVIAVAWYTALGALGFTHGSGGHIYGDLLDLHNQAAARQGTKITQLASSIVEHPGRLTSVISANLPRTWANISPGGVLGLAYMPVAPILWISLAESQLTSPNYNFANAGFQSAVVYPLLAVGTSCALAWWFDRYHDTPNWVKRAAIIALAGNAIMWAVLWLPHLSSTWIRVSPKAAAELARVKSQIPSDDEVVASQGVVGAFADRRYDYELGDPTNVPRRSRTIWIIVVPTQGIEVVPEIWTDRLLGDVARLPGIQEVVGRNGVWAFKWTPKASTRRFSVSSPISVSATVPAWTLSGSAGRPVQTGNQSDWYVGANGRSGYVLSNDYWREPRGTYQATVQLSATGQADVEVWDSDSETLLARNVIDNTSGRTTVSLIAALHGAGDTSQFHGVGPWTERTPTPSGDQIEIRVWSPGGNDVVNVYSVKLRPMT